MGGAGRRESEAFDLRLIPKGSLSLNVICWKPNHAGRGAGKRKRGRDGTHVVKYCNKNLIIYSRIFQFALSFDVDIPESE